MQPLFRHVNYYNVTKAQPFTDLLFTVLTESDALTWVHRNTDTQIHNWSPNAKFLIVSASMLNPWTRWFILVVNAVSYKCMILHSPIHSLHPLYLWKCQVKMEPVLIQSTQNHPPLTGNIYWIINLESSIVINQLFLHDALSLMVSCDS